MSRPIALVTGVFDIIHVGHLELLKFAYDHGVVLVGLNSDEAVRKLKGPTRPINTYDNRKAVVSALWMVEEVFEINSTTVDETIRRVAPRFWIKGGDYTMETLNQDEVKAAKEVGAEILLFPSVEGLSTTKILQCTTTTTETSSTPPGSAS